MSRSRIYGRTLARAQALQLLFQAEVADRAVDDVLAGEYVLSEGPLDPYGEQLARGVGHHVVDLDRVLDHSARNWRLSRMSAVERNLLRIALYELLYVDDVDAAVSISECVELAKAFGSSDESSRFVNGVLGRIAADIAAGTDVVEQARKLEAAEMGYEYRPAAERDAADASDAAEAGTSTADPYAGYGVNEELAGSATTSEAHEPADAAGGEGPASAGAAASAPEGE